MGEHYSPDEIEQGLEGRLPIERSKEIVRHLLKGCSECQSAVRRKRQRPPYPTAIPNLDVAYDVSLNRAEELSLRSAYLPAKERARFRKALRLLEEDNSIFAVTEKGRMDLKGLGVYEALLTRSWAIRFDSPRAMCHLARAAVEISHRLETKTCGIRRAFDFSARAWGELANAYRVYGQLRKSEKCFGQAYLLFQRGSRPRRLLIRLLDLEASLLGTLKEFDLGLDRLTSLAELYHEIGEVHMAGRTLITKSLYLYYKGDSLEALETVSRGLRLVDKDRDPSLMTAAAINQLLLMEECGRFREAKKILFKIRPQVGAAGRINVIKLRAIEGRINYGLGELASAERAFREVKHDFQEFGLAFTAAMAGLDLAMTLMRQGRTEEAIQEGFEATKLFVSLSTHREILGSVILLQEAFQAKTASISLIDTTNRYLRRRQIELNLR
jgi:tetratricopeptide (TPR) repeat protein